MVRHRLDDLENPRDHRHKSHSVRHRLDDLETLQ